jgi:hypothetical protein
MLAVSAKKHPDVPIAKTALAKLVLDAVFDAILCIDALEMTGPSRLAGRPGVGHHFCPTRGQVDGRLAAAGADIIDERDADGYRFLLVSGTPGGGAGTPPCETAAPCRPRPCIIRRTGGMA